MAKVVVKVYGDALFTLAREENREEEFVADAERILQILKDNKELDQLVRHPGISKTEKEAFVKAVFAGFISREMIGFLMVLVNKDRFPESKNIIHHFLMRVQEEKGIGEAFVTTAVELNADQKAAVMNKLLATTPYKVVEMHYNVDSSIIGGMIIRIKDRVADNSVRTKLLRMKRQLLKIQLG